MRVPSTLIVLDEAKLMDLESKKNQVLHRSVNQVRISCIMLMGEVLLARKQTLKYTDYAEKLWGQGNPPATPSAFRLRRRLHGKQAVLGGPAGLTVVPRRARLPGRGFQVACAVWLSVDKLQRAALRRRPRILVEISRSS